MPEDLPDAIPQKIVIDSANPLRISPTDISQFVRLEQCERYLRFRLAERAGQNFMKAYDVIPQRITPLLTLSGAKFEAEVEAEVDLKHRSVHYAKRTPEETERKVNNDEVLEEVAALKPGQIVVLFQPRINVPLHGFSVRGDLDLVRLERNADGALHVMIVDMKSTTSVKVEHRLQVAFYQLMIEKLLKPVEPNLKIDTGILYRRPIDASPDDETIAAHQQAAIDAFGFSDKLLEIVADPDAYLQATQDLVFSDESVVRRVSSTDFEELPFALSYKCDGCLYNEYCMKQCAEKEDLALLPYMSGVEKEALKRHGIHTISQLARLKEFRPEDSDEPGSQFDLLPATGYESHVARLASTWPVGPRLDELVHRARSFRRSARKENLQSLPFIPNKGASSLPASTPELNPNLVMVYLDAQHDYLHDRVYLLGALIVAHDKGAPAQRRTVVHTTKSPPERAEQERELLIDFTRELIETIVEVAVVPEGQEKAAPLHLVFFNQYEQRVLLDAIARNAPRLLEAAPPLYDFLTQLAAFDSPVATFLDQEIRTRKNFPMTCQSLQSLATYLKFDWNSPQKFREIFKPRLFDYLGKLDIDGESEWFTKRSRFNSQIPLECAYAAWGELPEPEKGKADTWADFRPVKPELLEAFHIRRLEALEHIAKNVPANPLTRMTPFRLPDLAHHDEKARTLAQALREFVIIERLVEMSDWRTIRHAPPETRVLMGETLVARYVEKDQERDVTQAIREHRRREALRKQYESEYLGAHPGETKAQLTKEQKAECRWSLEGIKVRLRLETSRVDCELHEALALSNIRDGERVVMAPRWSFDERLPVDEREPFTPTPKQLLYAPRVDLDRIVITKRNKKRQPTAAMIEVTGQGSIFLQDGDGFVFGSFQRPLEDGELYSLDPSPDDWYGYWCKKIVQGVCDGEPHVLYERLIDPSVLENPTNTGLKGQKQFLKGLKAFHAVDYLHDFEASKRDYIGGYGSNPVLLVQGPPGTGKSYATAFAVFARLQAAMVANRDFRVLLSCKTHAATDVLVANVAEVQQKLRDLREADPTLFDKHFDARILEVSLYRVVPRDRPPNSVIPLAKDGTIPKQRKNADVLQQDRWLIAAATPGGVYGAIKAKWSKEMFGHQFIDLLVLDEASQMNLPEALMAALPLVEDAQVIVVGDHRQMPPIVKHDWDNERRRTFQEYQVYESLFDTLRQYDVPLIQFAESFRLHHAMAEFLRQEIYRHDGIEYFSQKCELIPSHDHTEEFLAAVLSPNHPLTVVMHDEAGSQMRNEFEQRLIEPLIRVLADSKAYGMDHKTGLGIVVPHRAQRAALQQAFPELNESDPVTGTLIRSAVDTVERFQGGERNVILVSATESDQAYLLASSGFLLDPRRLTVALSRAKRKMILVASRSIFQLFLTDEEQFANLQLWKNLLLRTCREKVWDGEIEGQRVQVWGCGVEA